jgi:hypothetical protein
MKINENGNGKRKINISENSKKIKKDHKIITRSQYYQPNNLK